MIEPPAHTSSNPPPTIQVRLKPVNGKVLAFAGSVAVVGVLLVLAGEAVLDGVFVDAGIAIDLQVGQQSRMAASSLLSSRVEA